jgi:hypothetical protein
MFRIPSLTWARGEAARINFSRFGLLSMGMLSSGYAVLGTAKHTSRSRRDRHDREERGSVVGKDALAAHEAKPRGRKVFDESLI